MPADPVYRLIAQPLAIDQGTGQRLDPHLDRQRLVPVHISALSLDHKTVSRPSCKSLQEAVEEAAHAERVAADAARQEGRAWRPPLTKLWGPDKASCWLRTQYGSFSGDRVLAEGSDRAALVLLLGGDPGAVGATVRLKGRSEEALFDEDEEEKGWWSRTVPWLSFCIQHGLGESDKTDEDGEPMKGQQQPGAVAVGPLGPLNSSLDPIPGVQGAPGLAEMQLQGMMAMLGSANMQPGMGLPGMGLPGMLDGSMQAAMAMAGMAGMPGLMSMGNAAVMGQQQSLLQGLQMQQQLLQQRQQQEGAMHASMGMGSGGAQQQRQLQHQPGLARDQFQPSLTAADGGPMGAGTQGHHHGLASQGSALNLSPVSQPEGSWEEGAVQEGGEVYDEIDEAAVGPAVMDEFIQERDTEEGGAGPGADLESQPVSCRLSVGLCGLVCTLSLLSAHVLCVPCLGAHAFVCVRLCPCCVCSVFGVRVLCVLGLGCTHPCVSAPLAQAGTASRCLRHGVVPACACGAGTLL